MELSILERIRKNRLEPRKIGNRKDSAIHIKSYDKRVCIYLYDDLLLNYRYVAISVVDSCVYLEFTNLTSNNLYSVVRKGNVGQICVGGINKKILEKYAGNYNYTVVTASKSKSLIIKLKRKEV